MGAKTQKLLVLRLENAMFAFGGDGGNEAILRPSGSLVRMSQTVSEGTELACAQLFLLRQGFSLSLSLGDDKQPIMANVDHAAPGKHALE